jgi:hypothetical protein
MNLNLNKVIKEETLNFLRADIIQERIIAELEDLLAEGVAEGVADKYAEREFNIPDENSVSDVQASSYIQRELEKPIAIAKEYEDGSGSAKSSDIYKNPKSLANFDKDVRAIIDSDGNLYVMLKDIEVMHGRMGKAIGFNSYVYDKKNEFGLLHRVGNTNSFGLGDTGASHMYSNPEDVLNLLKKAKRKNPRYSFYQEYFRDVKPGMMKVKEGVADKLAAQRFNIPDPNVEMDKIAMSGIKDSSTGELVGVIEHEWIDWQHVEHRSEVNVYMNPKTLQNFDEDVRAITDSKGNLFIGQLDTDYYHGELAAAVDEEHPEYDLVPAYDDYDKKILWHRVGLSREFGLSVSYISYIKRPEGMESAGKLLEAVQRKNPQFEFVLEYWQGM